MTPQAARAAAPQAPILLRENVGSICVLTLNRPAARNSLSEAMISELHAALRDIHDDADVRALVIAANGPAFCAGHDMKELTARRTDPDRGRAYFAEIMTACSAMMQAIVQIAKTCGRGSPGHCDRGRLPAGGQLRSCSRLGSRGLCDARRGYRTVLFDAYGGAVAQRSAQAGDGNAAHRRAGPAATARDIGLVNRVVPAGTERDDAIALAQKVALKSAYTVKLGKAAFYRQAEMSLADAYRYAAEVMTENMMARDAEEGIGAFIEKREPKWQDR